MSKYDEILNELVYQIDDLIYDFYTRSNALVVNKRNQEQLLEFRDKTIATINDMNVRSLEMISALKSEALVIERTEHLLEKNKTLVASAMNVIDGSPSKSDFLEDVSNIASDLYESAKNTYKKVEETGVIDRIREKSAEGLKIAQEGFEEFANHPTVKKSAEVVSEKAKEAYEVGSKVVQDGAKFVADKFNQAKNDVEDSEIYKETEDTLQDVIDEVVNDKEGE